MQNTIGIEQTAPSGHEAELMVRTVHEPWNKDGERHTDKTTDYSPSPGQLTLLVAGISAVAIAIVYAFNRNRQRFLNDPRNIDRRWDRPDRLADTWYEDQRWLGNRRPADQRAGLRSHAEGFAV